MTIIALFVAASNIYAGNPASLGSQGEQSILSSAVDNGQDDLLVEEATQDASLVTNDSATYLGTQAVGALGVDSGASQYNGSDTSYLSDDIAGTDQTSGDRSPIANAVRNQPQIDLGSWAAPTRTRVEEHIVQQGETLGTIARQYGIGVETVLAANKLGASSLLHPGDKLRILPVDGIPYIVKRGDTLNKIATLYKSEPQRILDVNGIVSGSPLVVGNEIILPDGKLPPPPRARSNIASNIRNIVIPPASTVRNGDRFLWPTAVRRITQYFGAWEWRTRHTGVDIGGPVGTPIYAAADGVVISSGWNTGGYGNMVLIDHGGGWFTRYGHSSKLLVAAGDTVQKGQVISLMGSTGRSTGPHLHFEVMTGNVHHRVNPLGYIR